MVATLTKLSFDVLVAAIRAEVEQFKSSQAELSNIFCMTLLQLQYFWHILVTYMELDFAHFAVKLVVEAERVEPTRFLMA